MQSGLSSGTDDDFPISISGRAWAISQKGLAYTAFRAMAKAGQPTEWCCKYGLHHTCSFEVALYGDEVAALMGRAWSHRMQFLLDMWRASNDPGFVYDESCLSEYVEPSDYSIVYSIKCTVYSVVYSADPKAQAQASQHGILSWRCCRPRQREDLCAHGVLRKQRETHLETANALSFASYTWIYEDMALMH
jgi:hypothetical protein